MTYEPLTLANVEDRLTACFLAQWGDETPVVLKNQSFVDMAQPIVSEFVRFGILMTSTSQTSYGDKRNRFFRRLGHVYIQVFVTKGTLTSRINDLRRKVYDIYENPDFSPIFVREIIQRDMNVEGNRATPVAPKTDGVWFGTVINVAFEFDELK